MNLNNEMFLDGAKFGVNMAYYSFCTMWAEEILWAQKQNGSSLKNFWIPGRFQRCADTS